LESEQSESSDLNEVKSDKMTKPLKNERNLNAELIWIENNARQLGLEDLDTQKLKYVNLTRGDKNPLIMDDNPKTWLRSYLTYLKEFNQDSKIIKVLSNYAPNLKSVVKEVFGQEPDTLHEENQVASVKSERKKDLTPKQKCDTCTVKDSTIAKLQEIIKGHDDKLKRALDEVKLLSDRCQDLSGDIKKLDEEIDAAHNDNHVLIGKVKSLEKARKDENSVKDKIIKDLNDRISRNNQVSESHNDRVRNPVHQNPMFAYVTNGMRNDLLNCLESMPFFELAGVISVLSTYVNWLRSSTQLNRYGRISRDIADEDEGIDKSSN
jgi:hypothetical protein